MKKAKRLLQKSAAAALVGTMTAMLLAGCGSSSSEGSGSAAADAGELNIFIWTEYVPESVIQEFEEESGIKVNISYYSSNEDLYSKMKSEEEGTYDIVQPSDYMVAKLIDQGMLQKMDTSQLTNLGNISDVYMNPDFDPGNQYSVPYMGGVAAIAVNTSKITDKITSYADLFKEEYAGQEVVLDDSRAIIGIAAKSLGYSMSTTDDTELAAIKEQVLKLKNNVKVYDSDSPKSELISGDCSIGMIWNAEIALAMEENPDIEIVYPTEGCYKFIDSWCLTKGAKNVDNAMKFIDYMLSAKASAACSEELPYLNPNSAAGEILGEDYLNNTAENVPSDVISAGEFIQNLDTDTQAKYEDIWTELKK